MINERAVTLMNMYRAGFIRRAALINALWLLGLPRNKAIFIANDIDREFSEDAKSTRKALYNEIHNEQ